MSRQEIYHSTTLGPIPLSFTGRHLMKNLRDAMVELVTQVEGGYASVSDKWRPVSLARGKLAQYMSTLEQKQPCPSVDILLEGVPTDALLKEIMRRIT